MTYSVLQLDDVDRVEAGGAGWWRPIRRRGRARAGHRRALRPATDRWSPAGRLGEARTKHAAVRLPDGRVLLVGGARDRESRDRLASTELYDPATGRFAPGPRLRAGRYKLPDAVVALPDGRVLVAGDAPEVEIVDPARGRVTLARGDLGAARAFATATRVGADVLVLGGYDERIAIQAAAYLVG